MATKTTSTKKAEPAVQPVPTAQRANGMAIAALVLGIAGFIWMLPFLGNILGIIFGAIGLSQIKQGKGSGKAMAHVGLWLGVAGLVISTTVIAILIAAMPALQRNTKNVLIKTTVNAIAIDAESYYSDHGSYPASVDNLISDSELRTVVENSITYTPSCTSDPAEITAEPKCDDYVVKASLSNGEIYQKTSSDYAN